MKSYFFRPTRNEIFALAAFYFLFSFLYHVVLWYLGLSYRETPWRDLLSPADYWESAGVQYVQFFVASFLIWTIAIYGLRNRPQWQQMVVVALLIFPFIYVVRALRYRWYDYVGIWHLKDNNAVWDLYIPALFLLFQFGSYFAYVNFLANKHKLVVEAELRQAALKSELAALKAQLNPHFLYNVFNTINAALPAGSEDARMMVSRLSDLFRYQLRATREDLVPLADELEFVVTYLDLEHARFGDRLDVTVNVAPELMARKIPPMLLQPLVENSVKHGISSLVQGGSISIDVHEKGDKLHFRISDTGVGAPDKSKLFRQGVGLSNTRMRLEKMYGSELDIFDNQPQGLVVAFAI